MVANQPMRCTTSSGLQPIAASATRAARTARGLRTADLLRPSAAEQGLDLTGARRLLERILDLVPGDGRVHGEVGVAGPTQLGDRVDRGVDVAEHTQHTRRGRRVEDGGQRVRELHDTLAFPRCGAGSTSFTSEMDTVGKFFTNNRNHMKNQPKLPAMMPQSAHAGLYVALANRSNGSPASDTTMITKRSNHIPIFTKIRSEEHTSELQSHHDLVCRL